MRMDSQLPVDSAYLILGKSVAGRGVVDRASWILSLLSSDGGVADGGTVQYLIAWECGSSSNCLLFTLD